TVFSFDQEQSRRKAVISMILRSETGSLNKVIALLSNQQVNILAIDQTIPINGVHNVSFTLDVAEMEISIQNLVHLLEELPAVEKADLVAVE
ncbi:MAG: ACT domain-containing protein, partial [Floccifex sp.]